MDNNGGGRQASADQHEIELMKQQLLPSMSKDIEAAPKLSNELAGESSCCIFKVPRGLAGGIAEACWPCIVSIGPYHYGEPQLQRLQEHKWGYLDTMLDQTQLHGVGLEDLIDIVSPKEKMIQQCSSESTDNFSRPDLVKMMVLDGCFVIQFLRQLARVVQTNPQLKNSYVVASVMRDLLRQVGIGFKQREASTFLEIKFDSERRTIEIPKITIDDDLNWILPNMVAFEQCRGQTNGHTTAYATFMGCLIHTANDVQLLRDRKVISNPGTSNEDVARFFGDVCKDATINVKSNYLASHFAILSESLKYERAYLCCAQLLNSFHDNPWPAISGLAVVVTLVGIIQTVYPVLQYYHPK